jgi:hypothetical protein
MLKKIGIICSIAAGCASPDSAHQAQHSGGEHGNAQAEHDEQNELHGEHHGSHHGPPQVLVAYHDVLASAESHGELWPAEVATLQENGQALAAICADESSTVEVKEASIDTLHNTFHRLMELAR